MTHGKIFGPFAMLAGLCLVISQFKDLGNAFGFKLTILSAFILSLCIIINLLMGIFSGGNIYAELGINLMFLFLPSIFIINEFFFKIIDILPVFFASYYLLIMGIVGTINGIIDFF
jgi:hypothetical protein